MNHYTLAEMTPGLTEEFTVTVTPEMMDAFRAITGDVSPIHIDADYARGRGFPGRVQVCQTHFHRRHADRQGHGCRRQRDRQRGRDQGRYHEPGRQARDPRHHQGRVSKITRRKSCPIPI